MDLLDWLILPALIALFWFFNTGRPNAVWGGATMGLLLGAVVGLLVGDLWAGARRGVTAGALSGVLAEILGSVSDHFRRKRDPDATDEEMGVDMLRMIYGHPEYVQPEHREEMMKLATARRIIDLTDEFETAEEVDKADLLQELLKVYAEYTAFLSK